MLFKGRTIGWDYPYIIRFVNLFLCGVDVVIFYEDFRFVDVHIWQDRFVDVLLWGFDVVIFSEDCRFRCPRLAR